MAKKRMDGVSQERMFGRARQEAKDLIVRQAREKMGKATSAAEEMKIKEEMRKLMDAADAGPEAMKIIKKLKGR